MKSLLLVLGLGAASASVAMSAALSSAAVSPAIAPPTVSETRTYSIRQTVALHDVPASARSVRMWVPVPGDGPWQRVVTRSVVEAPTGWSMIRQPDARGDLIFVEGPGATVAPDGVAKVVVETIVQRDAPVVDLAATSAHGEIQRELFSSSLDTSAPLMTSTEQIKALADEACRGETDPARKVVKLVDLVGQLADHYSRDPSKPHCGRGAAEDCLTNAGGCCTDLHSLFVALSRSQGIPTRIQFGYRLNPARAGQEYDPSYRCWVEYWLDGSGWVPTDVVVADSGEPEQRAAQVGRLDARRVWLWEGRGFDLSPAQKSGPIQTMLCGWAEIDGAAVDPLPAADGTPPAMRRTIKFVELDGEAAGRALRRD